MNAQEEQPSTTKANDKTNSNSGANPSASNEGGKPEVVGLDQVTVTATRRVQPLQKVPVAVSVINGDKAAAQNLNGLKDMATEIPTVNFRSSGSSKDQALFVRGLGSVSTSTAVEPTVSTLIDGVVLTRQGQSSMDLLDVDRIEVLRGPQGTLFGKNASSGVLHIITKNPTSYATGYADLAYYQGNEKRIRAGVSGPLGESEQIRGLISAYAASYEGNVTNVDNNKKVNGYDKFGFRGKLEYGDVKTFRVLVTADYLDSRDTIVHGVFAKTPYLPYNATATTPSGARLTQTLTTLLPVVPSYENRAVNSKYDFSASDKNGGISAQVDWATGDYKWTSVTAWRNWKNTQKQDQARTPVVTSTISLNYDTGSLDLDQFSQEIRVASPVNQTISYVAGLYYLNSKDDETYQRDTFRATAPTKVSGIADYGYKNTNYSLFGESTINFQDDFRGILGVRWVRDELSYDFNRVATPNPAISGSGINNSFTSSGSTSKNGYAARAGLQYDLTAKSNLYFTLSRGYKGPGYNLPFGMLPQDTGALRPETSVAYELGYKASFGKVDLASALFKQDFKDYQTNFRDVYEGNSITRLINAGKVSTEGVEFELAARLSDRFRPFVSLALTKARVDQFICPPGAQADCNIDGKPLPYAPDTKVNVGAEYKLPLSGGYSLMLGGNYSWQSDTQYSINQTQDTIQKAFGLLNAYATLNSDSNWRVSLIGKNLTNQSYSTNLATSGGGIVRWVPRDDQRYFGLSVHVGF